MTAWNLEDLRALLALLRAEPLAYKAAGTALLVAIAYGLHRLLRYYIGRLVTRVETRVKYWNTSRTLLGLVACVLIGAVWLEELKTVTLVLAGVLAGILITGKELFLGLGGRMTLAIADHYKIGDRIRINGVCGDVINIGLLYTWLLEVEYDRGENQATGRVVLLPHLWLTQHPLINSTLGHEFVWDEIDFAFPLSVDGQRVVTLFNEAAGVFLRDEVADAARNVPRLGRQFAAKVPPVTPVAYAHLVMQGSAHQYLVVSLRYTVRVRQRRVLHSALTLHLLATLREHGLPVYQNFPYQSPAAAEAPPAPRADGRGAEDVPR